MANEVWHNSSRLWVPPGEGLGKSNQSNNFLLRKAKILMDSYSLYNV